MTVYVRFERLAFQNAIKLYDQVGAICANVTDGAVYQEGRLADSVRSRIQEDVCSIGGNIVLPIATCSINQVSGVEFGVFHDPEYRTQY